MYCEGAAPAAPRSGDCAAAAGGGCLLWEAAAACKGSNCAPDSRRVAGSGPCPGLAWGFDVLGLRQSLHGFSRCELRQSARERPCGACAAACHYVNAVKGS